MLAKLNLLSTAFARHERVKQQPKPLTHQQWVNLDRVVMLALFIVVIAGALIFS